MKNVNNPAFQRMLQILEQKYFYKSELFKNRRKIFSLGDSKNSKSINALVYEVYRDAPFILFISSKQTKILREKAQEFALSTETIGTIAFYSNTNESFQVLRRRYKDNKFETVQGVEYYYIGSQCDESENKNAHKKYSRSKKQTLIPITNELENIFFELHSVMRDIDGLHSDAALEELCKLLYLKSYLEENNSALPIESVSSSKFGSVEEYSSCLRALYREAINHDLRTFIKKIPEYERSRGVFDLPIHLSNAALIKSFQHIEDFSLTNSDTDLKGRAFQKVLSKGIRSGMGQYFTPVQVCKLMVEIISPKISDVILDPFCGSGHFLSESLAYVRTGRKKQSKTFQEFSFKNLHGIEKSDRMTRVAMTDMRLSGDGHSNIRCTDSLLDFRNYPDLKPDSFDVVLTNPPFGSILGKEAFSTLAEFDLSKGRKKVPLEIVGLERAIEFLRPGGRIAIVLPESIFSADSCKHVRNWLLTKLSIRIILDLPNETFAPFGANVRSGVLFARKLQPGEKVSQKQKVCMIKASNLGYDASGRPVNNSDVDKVVEEATAFLKKEKW